MTSISNVGGNHGTFTPVSPERSTSGEPYVPTVTPIFAKADANGSLGMDPAELQELMSDAGLRAIAATSGNGDATTSFSATDNNADGKKNKIGLTHGLTHGLKNQLPAPSDTLSFVRSRSAGAGAAPDHDHDGPHGPPPSGGGGGGGGDPVAASASASASTDPLDSHGDATVSAQEQAAGAIKQAMRAATLAATATNTGAAASKLRTAHGSAPQPLVEPPLAGKVAADGMERPPNYRAMALQLLRNYAQAAANDAMGTAARQSLSVAV